MFVPAVGGAGVAPFMRYTYHNVPTAPRAAGGLSAAANAPASSGAVGAGPACQRAAGDEELLSKLGLYVPKDGSNGRETAAVDQAAKTGQCQTCKNRKYQDQSNDAGVSFKSPAHISPQNASAVVRAHEQEHVVNAYNNAEQQGRKVVSAQVSLTYDICPECGRLYVSGGVTQVKTISKDDEAVSIQSDAPGSIE